MSDWRPSSSTAGGRRRTLVLVGAVLATLAIVVAVVVVLRNREDVQVPDQGSPVPTTAPSTSGPEPPDTETTEGTTPGPSTSGESPSTTRSRGRARLAQVKSWAFALGVDAGSAAAAAPLEGFDLVVLDGTNTSPAAVRQLQARGAIVLGYLNVGALEENRPWTAAAQRYRLDYWSDWNEWFARVSDPGYRALVTNAMAPPVLAKGFDGLFLDNIDMVESHAGERAGMLELVSALSRMVHARGGYLFAQNGDDVIDAFVPHLDGWNREDVSSTYDFDSESYVATDAQSHRSALATIARLRRAGLLVTSVDYTASADGAHVRQLLSAACSAGAVAAVADIKLTRVGRPNGC